MGYDFFIHDSHGLRAEGEGTHFVMAYDTVPRTLDAMNNFGMLVELPVPDLPEPSAYGLSYADVVAEQAPSSGTAKTAAEFWAARRTALDAAERDPSGIPSYKLRSRTGFLVTPAEITAALTTYEAHPHVAIAEMPVGDPTWRHWVAFLRRAKAHGGLRTL